MIPWESFRPLLDKGYVCGRKSNAGRKRIDPLILFKMLVLQQLFLPHHEELELQVNDRRSFEEFVDSHLMQSGGSYLQGYNCQLIVAVGVSNQPPDVEHLEPMLQRIAARPGALPDVMTMDEGSWP